MMNIDELTIGQLKEINKMIGSGDSLQPYELGKAYLIRTVTHIDIGVIEKVGDKELVLSDCSWIADTGRYHDAIKTGKLDEVEPYTDDVIIGRGSIVDATIWNHDLPRMQK